MRYANLHARKQVYARKQMYIVCIVCVVCVCCVRCVRCVVCVVLSALCCLRCVDCVNVRTRLQNILISGPLLLFIALHWVPNGMTLHAAQVMHVQVMHVHAIWICNMK